MTVWPLKWCHRKQPTKSTMAMIQNNLVSPTRLEGSEKREWEVNLHTCGLWILIWKKKNHLKRKCVDFPGGPVVKNLPASAGSRGSIPGLGRSHSHRATKPRSYMTEAHGPWSVCSPQEQTPQREACALQWRGAPACHSWRRPARSSEDPAWPKLNKEKINKI